MARLQKVEYKGAHHGQDQEVQKMQLGGLGGGRGMGKWEGGARDKRTTTPAMTKKDRKKGKTSGRRRKVVLTPPPSFRVGPIRAMPQPTHLKVVELGECGLSHPVDRAVHPQGALRCGRHGRVWARHWCDQERPVFRPRHHDRRRRLQRNNRGRLCGSTAKKQNQIITSAHQRENLYPQNQTLSAGISDKLVFGS